MLNSDLEKNNQSKRELLDFFRNQRRARATEIGIQSIDSLIAEGAKISYRTIALRSKEIDPDGKGIHTNTIRTNDELYAYYVNQCNNKRRNLRSKKSSLNIPDASYFRNIKEDRDVERVRKRYAKLNKSDLIMLLINSEQHIAKQNKKWLKSEFEQFK